MNPMSTGKPSAAEGSGTIIMDETKRHALEQSMRVKQAWERDNLKQAYDNASVIPMRFTDRLLLRHVLLLGASGSGKTNHAFHIIKQSLSQHAMCLVIDVKKEYRGLKGIVRGEIRILAIGDEPQLRFNPLAPPPGTPSDLWDRAFADVFTRAYGLSEPSRRIMLDCLKQLRRPMIGRSSFADKSYSDSTANNSLSGQLEQRHRQQQQQQQQPTLRELEREVAEFQSGSSKEQNSQRSLESRLHTINGGPIGASLNTDNTLDFRSFDGKTIVYEIGRVDSLRDQRFLAEVLLMQLWQYDKSFPTRNHDDNEILRRLIVIEEAHRYLSEERPPQQRGERTLLELAIAEARRYGWGFLIIDQMPLLLSRYVWDNAGTVMVHRLTNMDSYRAIRSALGDEWSGDERGRASLVMMLPEDLALFRRYVAPRSNELSVGSTIIPWVALREGQKEGI